MSVCPLSRYRETGTMWAGARMNTSDWIQAATLGAVAIALLLNLRQNREVARQTQELTQQNSVFLRSTQQDAYRVMVTHPNAPRVSFLKDDPEMLAWHLESRGYQPGTYQQNLRRLYVLLRLDTHELNFISHAQGLLTDDVWTGWWNVLKADFTDAEFYEAWAAAKHFYAPSFVTFVDELIADGRPDELQQVF